MTEFKYAIAVPKVQRINDIVATTVAGGGTDIGIIHTQGARRLFVVATVTIAALTGFSILARPDDTSPYVTLYSNSVDFTTPKGILIGASGDLTTQAVGTGWFILEVEGLESVKVHAISGGTAALALNMGAL